MRLRPDQTEELHKLAAPIRAFLRIYCHPHCRVVIEEETVEVIEVVSKTMDETPELQQLRAAALNHLFGKAAKPA